MLFRSNSIFKFWSIIRIHPKGHVSSHTKHPMTPKVDLPPPSTQSHAHRLAPTLSILPRQTQTIHPLSLTLTSVEQLTPASHTSPTNPTLTHHCPSTLPERQAFQITRSAVRPGQGPRPTHCRKSGAHKISPDQQCDLVRVTLPLYHSALLLGV